MLQFGVKAFTGQRAAEAGYTHQTNQFAEEEGEEEEGRGRREVMEEEFGAATCVQRVRPERGESGCRHDLPRAATEAMLALADRDTLARSLAMSTSEFPAVPSAATPADQHRRPNFYKPPPLLASFHRSSLWLSFFFSLFPLSHPFHPLLYLRVDSTTNSMIPSTISFAKRWSISNASIART